MTHPNHLRDEIQSAIIGLDEVARAAEATWGVGRLVRLVSDTTRLRFKRACELLDAAIGANDAADVQRQAAMMRRAWAAMDTEARAAGAATLDPVVWEALLPDGRVLAIVRTQAEAHAVARDNRAMVVWTMDEAARVLGTFSFIDVVKAEFPGARVAKAVQRTEGFASDWLQDDPMLGMIHEDALQVPA